MWPGLPELAPSLLVSTAVQAAGHLPSAQVILGCLHLHACRCKVCDQQTHLWRLACGTYHKRFVSSAAPACTTTNVVHSQVIHPLPTLLAARMLLPALHLTEGLCEGAGAQPRGDASPAHVGKLPKWLSQCCI